MADYYDFQDSNAIQLFFSQYEPPISEDGTPQSYVSFTSEDLQHIADTLVTQGLSKDEVSMLLDEVLGVETLIALCEGDRTGENSDTVVTASFDESGLLKRAYFPAIWQLSPASESCLLKVGDNKFEVTPKGNGFGVGALSGKATFIQTAPKDSPRGWVEFETADSSVSFKVPLMISDKKSVTATELTTRTKKGQPIGDFLRSGSTMTLLRDLPANSVYTILGVKQTPDNPYNQFMLETTVGNIPPNSSLEKVVNGYLTLKRGDWAALSAHLSQYNLVIGSKTELASGNVVVSTSLKFDKTRALSAAPSSHQALPTSNQSAVTVEAEQVEEKATADLF